MQESCHGAHAGIEGVKGAGLPLLALFLSPVVSPKFPKNFRYFPRSDTILL